MTNNTSPAPALTRGIRVLQYMDEDREYSLDELANSLDYPKSSLLRILDVLLDENLINRSFETKKYRPLTRLVALSEFHFETRLEKALESLASTTGLTAEWYEYSPDGMVLIRQKFPKGREAYVQAREGWLIKWDSILNAVNSLGIANFSPMTDFSRLSYYSEDGHKTKVTKNLLKRQLQLAKSQGAVIDKFVNSCSVRRIAAVITAGSTVRGVIALAEFVAKVDVTDQVKILEILQSHASKLS